MSQSMSGPLARSVFVALSLFTQSCSDDSSASSLGGISADGGTSREICHSGRYTVPWTTFEATTAGRYSVETIELEFVDLSRSTPALGRYPATNSRRLPVTVWLPRARLFGPSPGPAPLVIYSHGFASTRLENTGLARRLASHGFVVASTTFPASNLFTRGGPTIDDAPNQPLDVRFVISELLDLSGSVSHPLHGRLDSSRIAAVGFSLGAFTSLLASFHPTLRDPRIDAVVAVAPPAGMFTQTFYESASTPVLVIHGDEDAIVPYHPHATTFLDEFAGAGALLTVHAGTHLGFTEEGLLISATGTRNVDRIGCSIVAPLLGDFATSFEQIVGRLGGADAGVGADPTWSYCPEYLPPALGPVRQLAIEEAAVLSFLTAHLASDPPQQERACAYLTRTLPAQIDVSLTIP